MSPAPLVPGYCHPLIRIFIIIRIITRAGFKIKFPGPGKKQEEVLTCHANNLSDFLRKLRYTLDMTGFWRSDTFRIRIVN